MDRLRIIPGAHEKNCYFFMGSVLIIYDASVQGSCALYVAVFIRPDLKRERLDNPQQHVTEGTNIINNQDNNYINDRLT